MPGLTRVGVDDSAGHCFEPRPASTGSPDVFADLISITRIGDYYPEHCCGPPPPDPLSEEEPPPPPPCHDGRASGGSKTVFANFKNVHRIGDAIDCEDTAGAGSPTVFAGD